MQRVSKAYRLSMKSPLRERGYIMISFGLINQEAQRAASVGAGEFAYFSNESNLFEDEQQMVTYATLEENFTRVDGSMLFLPREREGGYYLDGGLVSRDLVSQGAFSLTIDLNTMAIDFKGMTIEFGENYPVDFDLVSSSGQVVEIRGNDQSTFVTEEVLNATTQVTMVFYTMRNLQSRVRIYSIMFGYGLIYDNEDVLDSTLESVVSPICEEIPSVDFRVVLKNYDKYFNVDNPDSAVHFMETGQPMEIQYGYELPETGKIEWIKGNKLYCSQWESDDTQAVIHGYDVYQTMDGEYYKGAYTAGGVSYYDLAEAVLTDAGIEDYYLDPRLKNLYTTNPLPRVSHKEALQIIANASRCILTQNRSGEIEMRSAFVPDSWATAEDQTAYARVADILNGEPKAEYASLATNYATADGAMYFVPRNMGTATLSTGYVSQAISDENGVFETPPQVIIHLEAPFMYYGVNLYFGRALPGEIVLSTYKGGVAVAERTVREDEIEDVTTVGDRFDEFDQMVITFTRTKEPHNRIVLNNFSFGSVSDLTLTRNDMTESPTAVKQELVKDVVVWCTNYETGEEEKALFSEDITVEAGEERLYYTDEPYYGFRVMLDESTEAQVVEEGSYYCKVRFDTAGSYAMKLYGSPYRLVERRIVKTLNLRGKTVEWSNPLVSDMTMAQDLADWLGEHYAATVEYRYRSRGNPELDTGDMVYQRNDFSGEDVTVKVLRQSLTFNGAFAGQLTTRRMEG